MNLTEHFTLEEFTRSSNAARLGIDNTPTPEHLENLHHTAAMVELIREAIGLPLDISSGYRCKALNDATPGSSSVSAHMEGLAADIKCHGMAPRDLAQRIVALNLPIDQIIYEFDSWVHVGLSKGTPRREVLTKRSGTPYMQGIV